jgi:hypothetical protein
LRQRREGPEWQQPIAGASAPGAHATGLAVE